MSQKKNEGILFPTEIRVVGSYTDRLLIRLKGFNNKISLPFPVCSTWPGGKAFARCAEGPEIHSGQNLDSLLFFFFSFSFRLVFILGITVLLCFYT